MPRKAKIREYVDNFHNFAGPGSKEKERSEPLFGFGNFQCFRYSV